MEALATLGSAILPTRLRPMTAKAMPVATATIAVSSLLPLLRTSTVPTMPTLVGGIHGAGRTLRLRASLRVLPAVLSFHRRAAEAFGTPALTVTTMALMRRIHRATLSFARAGSLRAVLRPAHAFGARTVFTAWKFRALLAGALSGWRCGLGSSRWGQRGCRRNRRRGCGFGILGQHWRDAEREGTAEPGDGVGFGFHVWVGMD